MSQAYSPQSFAVAPDFIVVVSNEDDYHANFHDFAEKVNRKLRAGYQLHGQPFNINKTICQAMLRPEGAVPNGNGTSFYKRPEEMRMV